MVKTTPDDLEAVRTIANALKDFDATEQERILRWAREKLGLSVARTAPMTTASPEVRQVMPVTPSQPVEFVQPSPATKDLKTFVNGKSPKNDIQFAATVAYYYRFEAPPEYRKGEIDATILQDACRLAGRARFNDAIKTLNNSKKQGLLDSGSERGKFSLNTVGENLVAMSLPFEQGGGSTKNANPARGKGKAARRKK